MFGKRECIEIDYGLGYTLSEAVNHKVAELEKLVNDIKRDIFSRRIDSKAIKLLIENGVNIDIKNQDGKTSIN